MTLPASGLISIGDIKNEYELGSVSPFCDRNALLGLSTLRGVDTAIQTPISLAAFHGKTKVGWTLNTTISFTVNKGYYYETPDYNIQINALKDHRFRFVRAFVGPTLDDRGFSIVVTKLAAQGAITVLLKRFRLANIVDSDANNLVTFTNVTGSYADLPARYSSISDLYYADKYQTPNVSLSTNYTLSFLLENFT